MKAFQTAKFTAEPGLSMTVNAPSKVGMGSSADIAVTVSKPGYNGTFKMKYEIQKPYPAYIGNGTIADMSPGQEVEMTGNSQTLKFTPTTAGQVQLLFTVTDEFGKSATRTMDFKIELLPIIISPSPLEAPLFDPNTITITIPTGNTPGQYLVSYEPLTSWGDPGTKKTGTVYFETETMEWHIGVQKTLETGTYTLTYTPSRQSDHYLHFTLIDANGEITTTTVKITTYL